MKSSKRSRISEPIKGQIWPSALGKKMNLKIGMSSSKGVASWEAEKPRLAPWQTYHKKCNHKLSNPVRLTYPVSPGFRLKKKKKSQTDLFLLPAFDFSLKAIKTGEGIRRVTASRGGEFHRLRARPVTRSAASYPGAAEDEPRPTALSSPFPHSPMRGGANSVWGRGRGNRSPGHAHRPARRSRERRGKLRAGKTFFSHREEKFAEATLATGDMVDLVATTAGSVTGWVPRQDNNTPHTHK